MFNIEIEVNKTLFTAFRNAVEKAYKKPIREKSLAEIKIGAPIFHNGLTFITGKGNEKINLSDGTEYSFLEAVRTRVYTV